MFRARLCAVLGISLMLVAASTEARELELSVDSRVGGDSNVFRDSDDEKADGFFELSPLVVLRERHSNLNYDIRYRPTYEAYFKTSGIDGFDHNARGKAEWRITPLDTATASGEFSSTRQLRIEDTISGGVPMPEESDRERNRNSNAELSYTRFLTPLLSLRVSGAFEDFDSSRDTYLASRAYSGQLFGDYALDRRTWVGLSGAFRHRESQGTSFQFTTDTNIWNIGASLRRDLSPTIQLSLQAGPSFVSTKQTPPSASVPPGPTRYTSDISYFASMSLTKKWQRSELLGTYTRTESRGSGTSSSAFVDYVALNLIYNFDRRWRLNLYGSWSHREEIASVPGSTGRDTTNYQVTTTVTRRITDHFSLIGRYSFIHQDQDGQQSIGFVHRGYFSVRYTFDPIVF